MGSSGSGLGLEKLMENEAGNGDGAGAGNWVMYGYVDPKA